MSHVLENISPFRGHFFDTGIGSIFPGLAGAAGGFLLGGPVGAVIGGAAGSGLRGSSRDTNQLTAGLKGAALGAAVGFGVPAAMGTFSGAAGAGAGAGEAAALTGTTDAAALASAGPAASGVGGGVASAGGEEALFSGMNFAELGAPGGGLEIPGGMAASGAGSAVMPATASSGLGGMYDKLTSFMRGGGSGVMGSGLSPTQLGLGGLSTLYGLNAASQLKAQGEELSRTSDPFGAYRPGYGNELMRFMGDPSSIEEDPAYKQSVEATRRAMAKGGYTASGNEMEALKQNYGNFYNAKVAQLAGLAGAGIGPNPNPAMAGSIAGAQLTGNSLANLGYMAALARM